MIADLIHMRMTWILPYWQHNIQVNFLLGLLTPSVINIRNYVRKSYESKFIFEKEGRWYRDYLLREYLSRLLKKSIELWNLWLSSGCNYFNSTDVKEVASVIIKVENDSTEWSQRFSKKQHAIVLFIITSRNQK
jgi:hypothetical protein